MKGSNKPPRNHPWRQPIFRTSKWDTNGPKAPQKHFIDQEGGYHDRLPESTNPEVAE